MNQGSRGSHCCCQYFADWLEISRYQSSWRLLEVLCKRCIWSKNHRHHQLAIVASNTLVLCQCQICDSHFSHFRNWKDKSLRRVRSAHCGGQEISAMLLGAPAPPPGRLVPPDQWSRCLRSSTNPPLPDLHRTRSLPRSAEKKKALGNYSLPCIKKKAKSAGRKSPSPAARRSPTLKLLPTRLRSRGGDSADGRVKLKAKAWATPPRNRRKSQICNLEVSAPPSLPPAPSPAPSTSSPSSPLAPLICGKRPPHIFSSPPSPLLTTASSHLSPRSNNQAMFSTTPPPGGNMATKGEHVSLPQIKSRAEVDEGTLGLLIQLCGLVRDISEEQKRQRGQKRTLALPRITSSSLSFPQRAFVASPLAGRRAANGRRSRLCNECLAKLYRHASEGQEVYL